MKINVIHRMRGAIGIMITLVPAAVSFGDGGGFDRYGIIIERRPFGAESVPVVAQVVVVPPEQSVVNQIRMSAVVRDNEGVLRVGLVDAKTKRNYMLAVGEAVDGVEIISADYLAERARLRRGSEDYWVSMQGGSNRFERVVEPVNTPLEKEVPQGKMTEVNAGGGVDQKRSYLLRRQQREEARLRKELARLSAIEAERAKEKKLDQKVDGESGVGIVRAGRKKSNDTSQRQLVASLTQTEALELTDEEIGRLLQEYQKELIRKGMTPLPIPLTPETDRQLVEEGYLPALE
jgi:hypothetical protein